MGAQHVDWTRYKAVCDEPDVLSRWMLEQTSELVADEPSLRAELVRLLERATPLDKPADHRGGSATDMFRVDLTREVVVLLCDRVESAVQVGAATSGTSGRGLGGFVEAWRECLASYD